MDVPTLCLAALARGPASGYEIRKAFEDGPFAHFHEASFGSIYPALRKLEASGSVVGNAAAQERRPDKRTYELTPPGRERLRTALRAPPKADQLRSDALVILFFAHLIPSAGAVAVLDGYLAQHRDLLAKMDCVEEDGNRRTPGERFVHGFGVAIYEAAVRYLENHRDAFVDQLTNAEATVA